MLMYFTAEVKDKHNYTKTISTLLLQFKYKLEQYYTPTLGNISQTPKLSVIVPIGNKSTNKFGDGHLHEHCG